MTNYFKVEGQCEYCGNMAVEFALHENMIDYVNVCEQHFQELFADVANEGIENFYEWATEMYGNQKALSLSKQIYGDRAVSNLLGDEFDDELVKVFTYGTLKNPMNINRDGGVNIIQNCAIYGHKMYLYNNAYPVTTKTDNLNDVVYGTLFEIPKYMVLHHYDIIEGYEPTRDERQNLYNRLEIEVTTPSGNVVVANFYYANQYMFADVFNKRNLISTGMWEDRHLAKSYKVYGKKRKGGK